MESDNLLEILLIIHSFYADKRFDSSVMFGLKYTVASKSGFRLRFLQNGGV